MPVDRFLRLSLFIHLISSKSPLKSVCTFANVFDSKDSYAVDLGGFLDLVKTS